MRRDHIRQDGDQHHDDDHHETRDGAVIVAEIAPEFPERMGRRCRRHGDGRCIEDFCGHRLCLMRGLMRP